MLNLLIIDKTAGLAASHERHQAIATLPDVELHVLGPKYWIENGREVVWNPPPDTLYHCHFGRVFYKDYFARAGYYSGLARALRQAKPGIIQLLEEPWSVSAAQTLMTQRLICPKSKLLFYTWENIARGWTYPSRAASLYRVIDRAIHTRAAGAICATKQAEEVLRKKGFSRPAAVIPYGIPNFFLQEHPPSTRQNDIFTIGYAGRMLGMKGVDLLLHAVHNIPNTRLILAGSGDDESQFRQLADKQNIRGRVEWIGSISEQDMPAFMMSMDVLILPSRTTPGWMEQLGRVLLEAMAVGTPVIGSSSGAIPEVIADAGLIFQENNRDDLCEKIQWLISNDPLRQSLINKGKQRVLTRFTWNNFATKLVEFYRTEIMEYHFQ